MTYAAEDLQPSIFLLHEDPRQSVVTIFNWTEGTRTHSLSRAELGLAEQGSYTVTDVFTPQAAAQPVGGAINATLPSHSVRVFKIIRADLPAVPPAVAATIPPTGDAGQTLRFVARPSNDKEPVLGYVWDFGDGTSLTSAEVDHAYTHAGTFQVRIHATGLDGSSSEQNTSITIRGAVSTKYVPGDKRRLTTTVP
jgi:PKD repeat protein